MEKHKTVAVLQFPLPFAWMKRDGKVIPDVFFSGVAVACALRDRIYSTLQILCTTEAAYNAMLQYSGSKTFQPYSNVSSFKLTVQVTVTHTTTPLTFNAIDVCRVLATPTFVVSEVPVTQAMAYLVSRDNFVAKDVLLLHDAGVDVTNVLNSLNN